MGQQADGGQENTTESAAPAAAAQPETAEAQTSEEALLQRALAMSMDTGEAGGEAAPAAAEPAAAQEKDLSSMTEEEQIAYAMQMSMAESDATPGGGEESMDVDSKEGGEDYSEVMNDPAFLQSVLQNLPGVDPQSEAVRNAMGALKDDKSEKKEGDKEKK